jgi:hypothetical protein
MPLSRRASRSKPSALETDGAHPLQAESLGECNENRDADEAARAAGVTAQLQPTTLPAVGFFQIDRHGSLSAGHPPHGVGQIVRDDKCATRVDGHTDGAAAGLTVG